MTDFERAKRWRTARGLTQGQVSDLTGFSRSSVIFFEQGRDARGREIDEFAFLRYKHCCANVARELDGADKFDW